MFAAFALDADPAERANVLAGEAWPRELCDEAASGWEALLEPMLDAQRFELDERRASELRQLGYGAGD